jgi:periplasmic copper chaperone A
MYKNILLVLVLVLPLFMLPVSYAAEASDQQASPNEEEIVGEKKATLEISDIWTRKSMSPNNNSAAYMRINNRSDKQITIIGASATAIANNVELHKSFVDEKGISRMTSIDNIVVPPQSEIELKPGGIHIMLFDLKRSLSVGDTLTLTIKIDGMDPMEVESSVK